MERITNEAVSEHIHQPAIMGWVPNDNQVVCLKHGARHPPSCCQIEAYSQTRLACRDSADS